jgi:predicted site-specific integrase-resolvase
MASDALTAAAAPVMDTDTPPPVFIKQVEAARRLSVSIREFKRWAAEGKVAVYRPSSRLTLVEWAVVERMVRESRGVAKTA